MIIKYFNLNINNINNIYQYETKFGYIFFKFFVRTNDKLTDDNNSSNNNIPLYPLLWNHYL